MAVGSVAAVAGGLAFFAAAAGGLGAVAAHALDEDAGGEDVGGPASAAVNCSWNMRASGVNSDAALGEAPGASVG